MTDDRTVLDQEGPDAVSDVPELGAAAGMLFALEAFAVALEAAAFRFEPTSDGVGGDRMALPGEIAGRLFGAFAGPAQGRMMGKCLPQKAWPGTSQK